MANFKKKRHPNARAGCHLCKPWKGEHINRDSKEFESNSNHKRRTSLKKDMEEWQRG